MTIRSIILAGLACIASRGALTCQEITHHYDHVLNAQGASRFTIATGIPYLAVGEYAYGVSDRFTFGVLAGVTPSVKGYGIRARTVLHENGDRYRVYFCTPVLVYPRTHILGGDPWWLARPNINFEWMTSGGFRYKVGGSFIAAASQYTLFGGGSASHIAPRFWDAIHGGISLPIGPAATLQVEASLVLKGLKVAGADWVGGPPVILVLGTSWVL